MTPQAENIERVYDRIAGAILDFFDPAYGYDVFHAEQLRDHVEYNCGPVAPGSADRILRQMRQKGVLDYRVVNRRQSLYEIVRKGQGKLF